MKKPPHRFGSRWRLQQLKRCHLVLHRCVLRGQETLHVLHLEGLQCPCDFCSCALSDHAVCLKQSHIDHIQTDFHKSSWQEEEWREQRAPPSACWAEVLSPPPSVGGGPGTFPTSLHEEKYKPFMGVNYLTKTGRFRVRIWWLDLTPGLEVLVDQNCDYFNMNLCDALFLHIQGKCIFDHLYHVFKSGTFMNLLK